jgi:glycylpeptide N-tetradecanoyltransferase
LAALLAAHYVSDAADAFRFAYSPAFLAWALAVPPVEPGAPSAWCVGVRATASGRLVAFIGAVPARLRVPGALGDGGGAGAAAPPAPPPSRPLPAAEVNFLCVHKKLRAKRLAPVLIRELTRRINAAGVWQAVYTAGVVLPRPAAVARYWHRSLDVAKLCAVGFTRLPPRMTMAQAARLHRLPGTASTPGLRPMRAADAPGVGSLLRAYLARFPLAPVLSDAEVSHCLTPRDGVVYSYVVEAPPKKGGPGEGTLGSAIISDLVSFYTLPSTVVGGAGGHATLKAAFQYYTVPGSASAKGLVADALVLARDTCVRL